MTATTRNIIEELKRAATEQGAGEAVRTIAALDDDPETSLAIMVAAVAASGRYPAYLR